MFYFPELYIINGFITLYTYVAWNITMFIYIMYTDAAYLETKHFNESLEELDGSASGVEDTLLTQMELYGRICDVIRELDRIFKVGVDLLDFYVLNSFFAETRTVSMKTFPNSND
ncbi:unnamed protein product [Nippostrongylus brasiliensis]|uniref:Gustatory receptor n=1 Tax=Nippostrongylus brasiliensis TaxID=27835 RepID=A0A0N4XKS7_NIPBR|nr:unnamed protein product [Nippostrongylus brasiliensis]